METMNLVVYGFLVKRRVKMEICFKWITSFPRSLKSYSEPK